MVDLLILRCDLLILNALSQTGFITSAFIFANSFVGNESIVSDISRDVEN
jgi:hypothetical protein